VDRFNLLSFRPSAEPVAPVSAADGWL